MMSFAEMVLGAMSERQWTQSDLARASGTSVANVSRWLAGKRTPSAQGLDAISMALGLDPEEMRSKFGTIKSDPTTLRQMYARMQEALKSKRNVSLHLLAVQTENRHLIRANENLHAEIANLKSKMDAMNSKIAALRERK